MKQNETLRSVEYVDNKISSYAARDGKCKISGKVLNIVGVSIGNRFSKINICQTSNAFISSH